MGLTLLTERYADQIGGILSCYDRIRVFGTLPGICFAEGITSYLYANTVRIFDYPRFAQPFRDQLRENADRLAREKGIEIQHIRKRNVRPVAVRQACFHWRYAPRQGHSQGETRITQTARLRHRG